MAEHRITENAKDLANIALGLFFAGLGTFLIIASQEFEDAGRSTPIFIGIGMISLSILLIVMEVFKQNTARSANETERSQPRQYLFVILMGAWIFLIPNLGFLLSGIIMFGLIAAIVPKIERWTPSGLGLHTCAGALTTFGFWFLLTHLLNTPLPELAFF